ncbi:acyl-CoA synthetase [Shinella sp. SUS2]|uniref:DUF4387 domain-containing protein n=1 Tax=unclassified Shinella TaxID=2643062 RepID=UPI00067FF61A|nr:MULTISPECIES: DUF4387 domain-containing protein [unclassified Shinella]KNY13252.1 acyl-CoA synthetase [Shinella sp. SUS2]KOC72063.1 acyl-CoA synthetase [Shinella sp. GWS1]
MNVQLIDIASVIRSKNSGPFELTLDVMFKTRHVYETVKLSNAINARIICRLYGIKARKAVKVFAFDPACAIKITFPRSIASGGIGDTDIYGAQQHAPLLMLTLDGVSGLE